MTDGFMIKDTNDLKKYFQTPRKENAPYIYLPISEEAELDGEEKIKKLIQEYKKAHYCGVIPFVPSESTVVPFSEKYYLIYGAIARAAAENGLPQRFFVAFL